MKNLIIVLIAGTLVSLAAGRHGDNAGLEGTPCMTYASCSERELVSEEVENCTTCRGPNVCKTVTTYMKQYHSGVYERKCKNYGWYGRYCYLQCVPITESCNVTRNFSVTEYNCCDGFTTGSPYDYHHYIYGRSNRYLKFNGCPEVQHDTILDCFNELGLTQLTSVIGSSLTEELGSTNSTPKFTVFAPVNEVLINSGLTVEQLQSVIPSHIAEREIHSTFFYNGKKIESLSPGRFIHVSQPYNSYYYYSNSSQDKTYINGIELLGADVCFASNGIVHLINGIIDSSDQSIADVVQQSPELSTMTSLLVAADLLKKLNTSHFLMTFFAPTDAAFQNGSAAIGVDIARCLLAEEHKEELKMFLKYHMTCSAEYSAVLSKKDQLTTEACRYVRHRGWYRWYRVWECKKVNVTITDDGISIGRTGSIITHLDVPASNGVVHYLSLPLVNPWLDLVQLCSSNFTITAGVPPPPPPVPSPVMGIN